MRIFKIVSLIALLIIGVLVAGGATLGWWLSAPLSDADKQALLKSPQYENGGFINIEPQAAFEFTWKSLTDALSADSRSVPTGEIPVVPFPSKSLTLPPPEGLRVTWIGHASVLVEIDGKRILTDPVFSERVSPFSFIGPSRFHATPLKLKDLQGIDAVVISHNHYDHLDKATTRHLARKGTQFFLPLGNKTQLVQWGVPEGQIQELDWWQEASIGSLKLIATPTRHYSNRGTFDYKQTLWTSWTIIGPTNRLFYSGDTGYSSAFRQIGDRFGPFDVTIIKVGSYGPGDSWSDIHMPPEESIQVHRDVRGKTMLPVHWGTFNLAYHAWDEPIIRTIAAAEIANINLLTPKIGEIVDVHNTGSFPHWWQGIN
ncbi:MAG: MBL fold metallo-hydrolase [Rhizobiaceae bacterium]|nr:MBL fold metallo-hydrolase [Rhizobiaceae bacterium]